MEYVGANPLSSVVEVAEFKESVHLPPNDSTDDAAIQALLDAAQEVVITATNRPLAGDYRFEIPLFPVWGVWWFPCAPVGQLLSIEAMGDDGQWQSVDLTGWRIRQAHSEPQLVTPVGWSGYTSLSADTLRVSATLGDAAGKTASAAIKLLTKEWYEAQIAAEDVPEAPRLSFGVRNLVKQARYSRPRVFGAG
ncbi:hypothetical protein TG4357_03737 [Thalassovita gelatinovora]|uniref:Phage gp6-like head-tail connector protein n=1 Tax=Thalassovita gelatinovora TaxID=53501 RepID=A0A0P1G5C1_THAGE|nr:phage gp6-like head-tail connector protein [Thalassovita gelatinovora]QIZ79071.1 phage gp6-like head-tail connector protein [Thalassovita gelatinovora]CUH68685.1 hypothetical protein TG4357_03737 [Thalassovita gelatinovora]SEQ56681.1 hypothetical protein SAMN04488043_106198 [Thalassovita gelatinovora]